METNRVGLEQTKFDQPNPVSVQLNFENQARKTPHALALKHDSSHLSFMNLNVKANQLSSYPSFVLNVAVGDTIGILFERSVDWLVSMIAILKTGARHVPIDPAYPLARIQHMLSDSDEKVLLTHTAALEKQQLLKSLREKLKGLELVVVDSPGTTEWILQQLKLNPKNAVDGNNFAYNVYTSVRPVNRRE